MLENSIRELNRRRGTAIFGMGHFGVAVTVLVLAQDKNAQLHRNFQGYTTHGHTDRSDWPWVSSIKSGRRSIQSEHLT